MPIKKDGTGKRWVEMEFIVPGTPEQVWQTMAPGPGNAAWFTRRPSTSGWVAHSASTSVPTCRRRVR
jgi:hypothetical protein